MKERRILTTVLLAVALLASAPAGMAQAPSADETPSRVVSMDDAEMVFHPDNHARSRKNADKVFEAWADKMMLRRGIRTRRLESIAVREDGAHLKYYFDTFATGPQRVELVVPNTTVRNWKEKRR